MRLFNIKKIFTALILSVLILPTISCKKKKSKSNNINHNQLNPASTLNYEQSILGLWKMVSTTDVVENSYLADYDLFYEFTASVLNMIDNPKTNRDPAKIELFKLDIKIVGNQIQKIPVEPGDMPVVIKSLDSQNLVLIFREDGIETTEALIRVNSIF